MTLAPDTEAAAQHVVGAAVLVEIGAQVGKRQFDGKRFEGDAEVWYEAKSGSFWDKVQNIPREMEKFKGEMGEAVKIAGEHKVKFEIISERAIPESVKKWLRSKGISSRVEPRPKPQPSGPMKYSAE